ncbi:MAG: SipW-dependent-type signal peptide-containing protein [Clostridiales bacterium]|nr:SipW-dependent-type signal peptide-containing protein [Candidatus Cacconaster stercorequi]
MKKRLLILSLLAVCLSLCIGGTLAYFTASGIARNVITTGNIKIDLIETDGEGNPFKNVSDVLPGAEVDKVVTVKNTGDNPCWVRISVEKEILLAEGKNGTPDLSLLEIDLNTEDWTEKDGFFYYNQELKAGETTIPLFTTATFNTAMDNLYAGCTANVTVGAQAVQTANNGSTALEANGWPVK